MTNVAGDESRLSRRQVVGKAEVRIQFEHRFVRGGHARPWDDKEMRGFTPLAGHGLHIGRGIAKQEGAALCQQAITDRIRQRRISEHALSDKEMLDRCRHKNNYQ